MIVTPLKLRSLRFYEYSFIIVTFMWAEQIKNKGSIELFKTEQINNFLLVVILFCTSTFSIVPQTLFSPRKMQPPF